MKLFLGRMHTFAPDGSPNIKGGWNAGPPLVIETESVHITASHLARDLDRPGYSEYTLTRE